MMDASLLDTDILTEICKGRMSESNLTPNRFPMRSYLIAVLFAFAAIFGFGWNKSIENQRNGSAFAKWQAERGKFHQQVRAEIEQVRAQLKSLHAKPDSQQKLADAINGGQSFDIRRKGDRYVADWSLPDSGYGFRLEFLHGKLTGWDMNHLSAAKVESRWEQAHQPPSLGSTEVWRRNIVTLSGCLWLIAFITWAFFPGWRVAVASVVLIAALACGMALLVNPAYSITWRGIFSNDNLFFGAVMLIFSIYLLAVSFAMRIRLVQPFPAIRFRLRDLLVMITVFAAMLAVGPFGYLTFAVILLGSIEFAAVFYLYYVRSRSELPQS
jgi:hypothetical protein